MDIEEILKGMINCLNSCIKEEERRKEIYFYDLNMVNFIDGRIDGYKQTIEMMQLLIVMQKRLMTSVD